MNNQLADMSPPPDKSREKRRPRTVHVHSPFVPLRDRATLERWIRGRTTPQRLVLRSRVVLLLAGGLSAREVGRQLGVSRHTVDLWRKRYLEEGCDTLTRDRPGRGRKRS
jgi:DNA-directed RNA polymerase specialized sigma24 family protein